MKRRHADIKTSDRRRHCFASWTCFVEHDGHDG